MQKAKFNTERKAKVVIGITGSFGSGKSTVARILATCGVKIIDADKIAHKIIQPGTGTYRKLIEVFGKGILKKNRQIERAKLARIVFNDEKKLLKLNSLMHPEVIRKIKSQIRISSGKVIILDVPLLIEAGLIKLVDKLVVVKISRKEQIRRMGEKFYLKKSEVLKRIRAQMPLFSKIRMADFIIDNSGSREETKRRVERIRRLLWRN